MEQTKNYKLSQWELSDRIQMKDFNGDNAKVEQALASLESRKLEVIELLDVSAGLNGAASWAVPMDGVKLGEYFAVFLEFDADMPFYLGMSGTTAYVQLVDGASAFLLVPLRKPACIPVFIPLSGGSSFQTWFGLTYANLEQLTILPASGRDALNGTVRVRITAIP